MEIQEKKKSGISCKKENKSYTAWNRKKRLRGVSEMRDNFHSNFHKLFDKFIKALSLINN